ncbi:MAG: AAA family ATPase, partial [Actinomycetota bacterium]|nr:AAA family ATPase [Actinomycetota bacterium]
MNEPDRAADGGPRVPQDLVDVTAAGECVLFAGAGIGAAAGFPYWRDVLRGVLSSLTAQDERAWRDLARQVEAGETQLVAELMRSRLEPAILQRLVGATYHRRREPTRAEHELLKRLDQLPWSGIVTDVWGDALELFRRSGVYEVSPADELDAAQLLAPGTRFLLKAYGDIEDPSTFLFSFEDYRRAVSENRSYELFLGTLFSRRTLLFLGTSIEGVEQFCIGSGLWERSDRTHYAVVPDNPAFDLQRERMDSRFGVKLLSADPRLVAEATNGFVARLHRGTRRRLRPTRPRVVDPPERLYHVHLENIGPFEQLSLDVGRPTTVLLGDNGSGKTTVLRAIALALCGSAAETVVAPSRLLRADASAGQIVLETSNATYRTTLRRERSVVRADARGVTSVEAGVLLALGVPSLR